LRPSRTPVSGRSRELGFPSCLRSPACSDAADLLPRPTSIGGCRAGCGATPGAERSGQLAVARESLHHKDRRAPCRPPGGDEHRERAVILVACYSGVIGAQPIGDDRDVGRIGRISLYYLSHLISLQLHRSSAACCHRKAVPWSRGLYEAANCCPAFCIV